MCIAHAAHHVYPGLYFFPRKREGTQDDKNTSNSRQGLRKEQLRPEVSPRRLYDDGAERALPPPRKENKVMEQGRCAC